MVAHRHPHNGFHGAVARVLILTTLYPTPEDPAAGTFVREHARAAAIEHDVAVVHVSSSAERGRSGADTSLDGDSREPTGEPLEVQANHSSRTVAHREVGRLTGAFRVSRRLRERTFEPNVIHAYGFRVAPAAYALSRARRLPFVVTEYSTEFQRDVVTARRLRLLRWIYRRADAVMPVSPLLQRTLEKAGFTADYRVVPNTVDTTRFYPPASFEDSDEVRLLFVGFLDPSHKKGVPDLLEALPPPNGTRAWSLEVIGDGPARAGYQAAIEARGLGDHVMFRGRLPPMEVAAAMRRASYLVHPARTETFTVVVAEALCCGLPVIATETGAIPEMVTATDGGTLVRPHDVEGLRRAIAAALGDPNPGRRAEIAERASRRYSLEAVGRELSAVYAEVAGR